MNIDDIFHLLSDILVERGKLSAASRAQALQLQQGTREDIVRLLLRLGMVSELDMAEVLSELCEVPLIRSAAFPAEALFADKVRHKFVNYHRLKPVASCYGSSRSRRPGGRLPSVRLS